MGVSAEGCGSSSGIPGWGLRDGTLQVLQPTVVWEWGMGAWLLGDTGCGGGTRILGVPSARACGFYLCSGGCSEEWFGGDIEVLGGLTDWGYAQAPRPKCPHQRLGKALDNGIQGMGVMGPWQRGAQGRCVRHMAVGCSQLIEEASSVWVLGRSWTVIYRGTWALWGECLVSGCLLGDIQCPGSWSPQWGWRMRLGRSLGIWVQGGD